MKKFLAIYALLTTAVAVLSACWANACRSESQRLSGNIGVLTDSVRHYRTRLGEEAASTGVLQLRCREFARLREADAARIRNLEIRLRRLEAFSKTATVTGVGLQMPLVRDTLRMTDTLRVTDTVVVADRVVRSFGWSDGWVTVEGRIAGDSVGCSVTSVDTLRQILHRVPRRFLFIRWGTKCVRQEIVSSNPHTRIVGAEYIEFSSGRR